MTPSTIPTFENLTLTSTNNIFIITLCKAPENRLTAAFCQEIIRAYNYIQRTLGPGSEGAVITRGSDEKFWCTGVDLAERDTSPYANADGFFPMLHTILDFPFPTIALITGHTFGGGCPFALSHDYRVMNSNRGFICMPPVNLGLHFEGMGTLLRTKLTPKIARKMLLEAHRWTGEEAFKDGLVDAIAPPDKMLEVALDLAKKWAPKAEAGVYGVLRAELYGEANRAFQAISYVHSKMTDRKPLMKL